MNRGVNVEYCLERFNHSHGGSVNGGGLMLSFVWNILITFILDQ